MTVPLRPLYGITCFDEPLPPVNASDLLIALEDAAVLRAALERAPAPIMDSRTSTSPERTPGHEPGPGFSPNGPRR
jgi:hypothetical protein